ncbi:MAG: DsbA family protein [Chloroflexota bacterium]|nr:DsbA family protein [Chloroflexota bacterium]
MAREARRQRGLGGPRRRREQRRPPRLSRRLRSLGWLVAVVVAVAAVAGLIVLGTLTRGGGVDDNTSLVVPTPRGPETPSQGSILGSANAPLTIVEYSDFQCPFCGELAQEIMPQLEKDYLATGKAKLVFKYVRFLGDESQWAAEAADCAGEQGKFWDYHDMLFANQRGENKGAFSKDNLKRFAAALNLDTTAFNACLDEGRYTGKVAENNNEARTRGINSTPTVFVGQTSIVGLKSYEAFKTAIEEELARAR